LPVKQISILLGHANNTSQRLSTENTQEYLNVELGLEVTVNDFVPF
jgi:hypothetical protein